MQEILCGAAAQARHPHDEVHFFRAIGQLDRQEVGDGGLLAPDEGARLFETELAVKLPVEELERFSGRELGGPQFVVGRHGQGGVVPIEDSIGMIHRMEERNGLPPAGGHKALAADLQAEHQVEVRQPRLAATFSREHHRLTPRGTAAADVGLERAETAHPIDPAAQRVAVMGIVARQAGAGLVHVNPIHPEFVDGAHGQAGVFLLPELRAHAHRRAGLLGVGVIDFGMDLAIRAFDREPLGVFVAPTTGGDTPEPLVHIDERVDALGLRGYQRVGEALRALARRKVFGETGVVSTPVPPMPEHADGQPQFLLQYHRRLQNPRRSAPVPHPQRRVARPSRHPAARQPALLRPDLVGRPRAVTLRRRQPVPLKRPEPDGIRQPPRVAAAPRPPSAAFRRQSFRQVHHFAAELAFRGAEDSERLVEHGGVIAGHIQPRPVLPVEGQALHGQDAGIRPLLPLRALALTGKEPPRLGQLLTHPDRHRQPLVLLARDIHDAREPDLPNAQSTQAAHGEFPPAHRLAPFQSHHHLHAQRRRGWELKLFPSQAQSGFFAADRLGVKGLRVRGRHDLLLPAERQFPKPCVS